VLAVRVRVRVRLCRLSSVPSYCDFPPLLIALEVPYGLHVERDETTPALVAAGNYRTNGMVLDYKQQPPLQWKGLHPSSERDSIRPPTQHCCYRSVG